MVPAHAGGRQPGRARAALPALERRAQVWRGLGVEASRVLLSRPADRAARHSWDDARPLPTEWLLHVPLRLHLHHRGRCARFTHVHHLRLDARPAGRGRARQGARPERRQRLRKGRRHALLQRQAARSPPALDQALAQRIEQRRRGRSRATQDELAAASTPGRRRGGGHQSPPARAAARGLRPARHSQRCRQQRRRHGQRSAVGGASSSREWGRGSG